MASLTGKQIDNTYDGLIKTNDEQPINATPKRLQDGLGNDLPVQVGTAGMIYNGAQDFTGATVTGITGTDTTYTLGVDESVPDGIITLTASDGTPAQEVVLQANGNISMDTTASPNTIDVTVAPYSIATQQDGADAVEIQLNSTHGDSNITLDAGTNITLTQTGNNILIDAAGGGTNTTYDFGAAGAAGNVNFALTGSDATNDVVTMQAGTNITLTDNGSNTFTIDAAGGGGAAGLVSGTGADSLKQADTLTTSAATAAGGQSIALGNGARATQPATVAIGDGAESTAVGAASIGQYATASGIYSSAWGRTANATADGSVAFGQQAQALHAGAIGMGRQVETVYTDTTHVRELMVVAPDGGTGGNGVILLSPNGTAYKLTVDNSGTIISTLV